MQKGKHGGIEHGWTRKVNEMAGIAHDPFRPGEKRGDPWHDLRSEASVSDARKLAFTYDC